MPLISFEDWKSEAVGDMWFVLSGLCVIPARPCDPTAPPLSAPGGAQEVERQLAQAPGDPAHALQGFQDVTILIPPGVSRERPLTKPGLWLQSLPRAIFIRWGVIFQTRRLRLSPKLAPQFPTPSCTMEAWCPVGPRRRLVLKTLGPNLVLLNLESSRGCFLVSNVL